MPSVIPCASGGCWNHLLLPVQDVSTTVARVWMEYAVFSADYRIEIVEQYFSEMVMNDVCPTKVITVSAVLVTHSRSAKPCNGDCILRDTISSSCADNRLFGHSQGCLEMLGKHLLPSPIQLGRFEFNRIRKATKVKSNQCRLATADTWRN